MNLYEKISQVMKDVAYLAKDDSVETGGGKSYKAITEEKVTSTVRESLIKNGLIIVPIAQAHRREDETVKDKYGNERINRVTTVDVTYRIINIEKPDEYIDTASSGTGVDTQDKGVGKAMTYAYKYMLLRTFAIPTGEDADKISSDLYDIGLYGKQVSENAKKDLEKAKQNFDEKFASPSVEDLGVQIINLCAETNVDMKTILAYYSAKSLDDMSREQCIQAIAKLEKTKSKNAQ